MREQCALLELVKFLDGGETIDPDSKLHGLHVLCTAQIRMSAAGLS